MKNNKKTKSIKRILFFIVLIGVYTLTLNLLNSINLDVKNTKLYKFLINNSSSLSRTTIFSYDRIKEISNFQPNKLLSNNIVYVDKKNEDDLVEEVVIKDNPDDKNEEVVEEKKDPIVYIYNTHQTEAYDSKYLADYSIVPDVMVASYKLKENLEKNGIYAYVEESSVSDVLNKNKWKYASSYKVTKQFMTQRKKEIPTLKYYIDLHRDSVKRQYTTTEINGVSYAKIMLLVGLDHDNYQVNLKEAKKINDLLNKKYPSISRGIYKKSGKGVNGIYNQDFSKYTFLFEVGGVDNNIEEVNNSINALTEVLVEYIKSEEGVE